MTDREFLMWLHERLTVVHGENESYDYMHRLRAIICATPTGQDTSAMSGANNLVSLRNRLATQHTDTED